MCRCDFDSLPLVVPSAIFHLKQQPVDVMEASCMLAALLSHDLYRGLPVAVDMTGEGAVWVAKGPFIPLLYMCSPWGGSALQHARGAP